jgi:predicted nucleic acid-binding protein
MAKIFWDTNLFIYLFEANPLFSMKVVDVRKRMIARSDHLFTSTLTVGEILVKPNRDGAHALAEQYRRFFESSALIVLPFDHPSAITYADIRRDPSLSRADSMQLACAAAHRVDLFLTNDERLHGKIVPGIHFICGLDRIPI